MELTIIAFLIAAALWTSQTFSQPKKKEEKKTPEQELTEAIGKYLAKGNTDGFEFNLKIQRNAASSKEAKS